MGDQTSVFSLAGLLEIAARIAFGAVVLFAFWAWSFAFEPSESHVAPPRRPASELTTTEETATELVTTTQVAHEQVTTKEIITELTTTEQITPATSDEVPACRTLHDRLAEWARGACHGEAGYAPLWILLLIAYLVGCLVAPVVRLGFDWLLQMHASSSGSIMEEERHRIWETCVGKLFHPSAVQIAKRTTAQCSEMIVAIASKRAPRPLYETALTIRTLGEMFLAVLLAGLPFLLLAYPCRYITGNALGAIWWTVGCTVLSALLSWHMVRRYAEALRDLLYFIGSSLTGR